MPELDPTSLYAHLFTLVQEHRELRQLIESRLLDEEDMIEADRQRQMTHTQIMEELVRLGHSVQSRQEALHLAETLVWWYRLGDEEE